MQRITNYGSFLQSYGLMKVIESLGHNVEFVDYHIESCIEQNKKKQTASELLNKLLHKANNLVFFRRYLKRKKENAEVYLNMKKEIDKAYKTFLHLPDKPLYLPEKDVLVIGSDEVFNCLNSDKKVGFSLELFGKNHRAKKLISYAGSFGSTTYEKLCALGVQNNVGELFRNFYAISVRDKNSGNAVKQMIGKEPFYHLDPVLIYPFAEETASLAPPKENNFILIYAYPGRISNAEASAIRKFARERDKTIISIGGYQNFSDKNITCSPFELLNYFKKADYIITDTFHGTIISIKYNKPFSVFVRNGINHHFSNHEKLLDLIEKFSMTSRIVNNDLGKLARDYEQKIDFTEANKRIEQEILNTREYLASSLKP